MKFTKIKERMNMEKISGVYKIENTITGDFYIGSSKDVRMRWNSHKQPSCWKYLPNSPMYKDMQKYGVENFEFTILCEVEPEQLTVMEQKMIQELRPTYNKNNAYGTNIERYRRTKNEIQKKYWTTERGKKTNSKNCKKYLSKKCYYNGETLTLNALSARFRRVGIEHPTVEARKYLIGSN